MEIVGVVANVRSLELREEPESELYFSALQTIWPGMSLVVRSSVEPASLSGSVRQIVNEVDKTVPVSKVQDDGTRRQRVDHSTALQSVSAGTLRRGRRCCCRRPASTELLLTQLHSGRTSSAFVIALGAQVSDVLKMILGQGMAVIGIGLVLGLVAAFALMRLLRSLVVWCW